MMGRKIVNEVTLADFMADPSGASWNEKPTFHTMDGVKTASEANLWADHDHETMHMWNMSIDLNSCTGCGACVIACHLENNVPVVGKDEIRNFRDMHWLRIDRYYSSDMTEARAEEENIGAIDKYAAMEVPGESPEVVFQPVMCQHCNHAPCETVCPVGATVHSREGLNHMAYNRCIGTRYCANNCPYKVRRFNWFNYQKNERFTDVNPAQDDFGRMVLNPDVTVRARGVMEKCTMCLQRIQYGKLEAKKAGQPLADGAFTTACAQACDTGAITFGDVNTAGSAVQVAKNDARSYHLLEEVGTQPSVFYQTKVRNRA
jgi:molybdopterin-containing oxidoreductase family iron-sulfur binding subunit